MKEQTIAILMATYNGERFLREQLDSIMVQTCHDWHLYVHDDGSTDATMDILKDYAGRFPQQISLLDYASQGGACRNFLSMMERVDAPYYMFCDQDDVWVSEKVEISLKEMQALEASLQGKGIVVFSDLCIVDEHLKVTYESMWLHTGVYPQYLRTFDDFGGHTANVTGSTMLFNKQAKLCCRYGAQKAIMHDCWVCLCTLKEGGLIHGINQKLVLYRQHGNNCLGSGDTEAKAVNWTYRLRHLTKVIRSNRNYYAMLASLGYGSIIKYIKFKLKYKKRIRLGRY